MSEHATRPEDTESAALICEAIRSGLPLAVSKFGFSEQAMLVLPGLYEQAPSSLQRRALSAALLTHGSAQGGLFPPEVQETLSFAELFRASLMDHDVLASFEGKWLEACQAVLPRKVLFPQLDAFDVRWADANHPLQMILNSLSERRVLIVTSPADFLVTRATPEIFEKVWAASGREWFSPASVQACGIPNAFDARVRSRFGSTSEYVRYLRALIQSYHFDVALIGASLCGPVLAAEVKRLGKVGISIGSQLQLLFGVHGKRWYAWTEFQEHVVNSAWTTLPESHRPQHEGFHADGGAYWA